MSEHDDDSRVCPKDVEPTPPVPGGARAAKAGPSGRMQAPPSVEPIEDVRIQPHDGFPK